MRIGVIAPPWLPVPPPHYGGTEEVISLLARGLQAAGHEVILYATGDSTSPVRMRWAFANAERERMGCSIPELYHVLRAYEACSGCDVVHDHTVFGPFLAGRRGDRRVVTTNHSPFTSELTEIYRRIDRVVSIIAISHDQASRAGGVRIERVIHHGLDPADWQVGSGDGGYLLSLGRMAPEKGVHRAIQVARASGWRLFIGAKMQESREQRYFAECVEPLLGDDVVFLGEVDQATKTELLGGARALLNPIEWPEPFGLVMIEALASGTPVLAFPEGAAPEIVEDGVTGFLCRDEDAMIEAVGRLDRLDRVECRRRFEQRFTAERMVSEHLELYAQVVSRLDGALSTSP